MPSNPGDPVAEFRHSILMTQFMQGVCIKNEAEHYRRIRDECDAASSGCTMGTLYWQANDIWPGASWASLVRCCG